MTIISRYHMLIEELELELAAALSLSLFHYTIVHYLIEIEHLHEYNMVYVMTLLSHLLSACVTSLILYYFFVRYI